MTNTQNAAKEPAGWIVVERTTYQVFVLGVGDNSRKYGIVGNYALIGPKGASYFVTDHGPNYKLNSVATGKVGIAANHHSVPAARPLRGLTRDHLARFAQTADQTGGR